MRNILCVVVSVSVLNACATANAGANYRPVVDTKGRDVAQYENDLRECQSYALQVSSASDRAAAGAVVGAVFGALLVAASGAKGYRNEGAAVGALTGAAEGAVQGETDQRKIIKTCLSNRGYSVLA
jgi:uncharacterized protein YcfJ